MKYFCLFNWSTYTNSSSQSYCKDQVLSDHWYCKHRSMSPYTGLQCKSQCLKSNCQKHSWSLPCLLQSVEWKSQYPHIIRLGKPHRINQQIVSKKQNSHSGLHASHAEFYFLHNSSVLSKIYSSFYSFQQSEIARLVVNTQKSDWIRPSSVSSSPTRQNFRWSVKLSSQPWNYHLNLQTTCKKLLHFNQVI